MPNLPWAVDMDVRPLGLLTVGKFVNQDWL